MPESIGSPVLWMLFSALVIGLLALDLWVFHRRAHAVGVREAFGWSVFWIALALLFNMWVALRFGSQRGLEFLTGYLIEKALSVDNLFVFLAIFSYFSVPRAFQHRVLFLGVLGAIILRAAFIFAGAALLHVFHWVIFVFGGFLVLTGVKIMGQRESEVHPEKNPVLRLMRKFVPAVSEYHGTQFFLRKSGRLFVTPLLLVLVVIETSDVIFAIDSIPAVFAVTRDTFIVYTSNICAILGLRALYFLLAGVIGRFRYLKVGLGLVLVFVGIKMLVSELCYIPIWVSLAVVGSLIGASMAASLLKKQAHPMLAAPLSRKK